MSRVPEIAPTRLAPPARIVLDGRFMTPEEAAQAIARPPEVAPPRATGFNLLDRRAAFAPAVPPSVESRMAAASPIPPELRPAPASGAPVPDEAFDRVSRIEHEVARTLSNTPTIALQGTGNQPNALQAALAATPARTGTERPYLEVLAEEAHRKIDGVVRDAGRAVDGAVRDTRRAVDEVGDAYSSDVGGIFDPSRRNLPQDPIPPLVGNGRMGSTIGMRWRRMHTGDDINYVDDRDNARDRHGRNLGLGLLVAPVSGVIEIEHDKHERHNNRQPNWRNRRGYGNQVFIRETLDPEDVGSAPRRWRLAHLDQFAEGLETGMFVRQGQLVGVIGNTGHSSNPHLHMEVQARIPGTTLYGPRIPLRQIFTRDELSHGVMVAALSEPLGGFATAQQMARNDQPEPPRASDRQHAMPANGPLPYRVLTGEAAREETPTAAVPLVVTAPRAPEAARSAMAPTQVTYSPDQATVGSVVAPAPTPAQTQARMNLRSLFVGS